MIKYKKLKIKNEEKVDELDINDVEPLDSFGDIHFKNHMHIIDNAIIYPYYSNLLKYKAAKLNSNVDWIIREYEGELYLIALKKNVK